MSQALTGSTAKPCHKLLAYKSKKEAEDLNQHYQQFRYITYRCTHCRKWHLTFVK